MRGYNPIYIDENGFNEQLATVFGYAKVGERCVVKTPPRSYNISVLTAVSNEKFFGL